MLNKQKHSDSRTAYMGSSDADAGTSAQRCKMDYTKVSQFPKCLSNPMVRLGNPVVRWVLAGDRCMMGLALNQHGTVKSCLIHALGELPSLS